MLRASFKWYDARMKILSLWKAVKMLNSLSSISQKFWNTNKSIKFCCYRRRPIGYVSGRVNCVVIAIRMQIKNFQLIKVARVERFNRDSWMIFQELIRGLKCNLWMMKILLKNFTKFTTKNRFNGKEYHKVH